MRRQLYDVSILLAILATMAGGQVFYAPSSTDVAYSVALVDATDGHTAETEKKAADTTITYCNITDANSTSSYTDADGSSWYEIGDGTGDYKLVIGASEFTSADKEYFVKIVVPGCRTVRFRVHTGGQRSNMIYIEGSDATDTIDSRTLAAASYFDSGADTVTLADGAHGGASTTITLQAAISANATQISGSTTAADNHEDFFANATAYGRFDDFFDGTKVGVSDVFSDAMTTTNVGDQVRLELEKAIDDDPNTGSISERVKAIDDKLPSKNYLTGTANSDGDIEADGMTGNFAGSVGSVAAAVTPDLTTVVDGSATIDDLYECMLAYLLGEATVVDNGTTRTITFYKQDGSTAQYQYTASETDGSRSATGSIDP